MFHARRRSSRRMSNPSVLTPKILPTPTPTPEVSDAETESETASVQTTSSRGSQQSRRSQRIHARAFEILREEAAAQQLAASMRPAPVSIPAPVSVSAPQYDNKRDRVQDRDRDRDRNGDRDCDRRRCRPCTWDNCATSFYTTPWCVTAVPVFAPMQTTTINTSVDTVCNLSGGCYSVSQPVATTCNPFGCSSFSVAPPNLVSVRDANSNFACSIFP